MPFKYPLYSVLVLLVALVSGCRKEETTEPAADFNRQTMLQNFSGNMIVPAYQDLQTKTNAMASAITAFTSTPNAQTLSAARSAWDAAYFVWQSAQHFDFGPAETSSGVLSRLIGVFPVNATDIESRITASDTTLNNFSFSSQGFLAIDYLLFNDSLNTITTFSTAPNAAARRAYLRRTAAVIKERVDNTLMLWQNTYKAEFDSKTGTNVTSSTTIIFNAFVASYENMKNFKVGFPAGKRAGQSGIVPTGVEAFYSGRSVKFMKAHLASIEKIWLGVAYSSSTDGAGFEEYIRSTPNGEALITNTKTQLAAVKTAMNALPENTPLSQTLQQNFPVVDAAFTEMQRHTRFFKSDMSSLLGLTITFSSNDGD
jgi:uncharacterized protein